MNLEKLRKKYIDGGYNLANASAKICQDIILNKIFKSDMRKNVTIKGGVVMYALSNDRRRATRDLDLDFIKYSLEDNAIKNFIDKLNLVDDGIKILIDGEIKELHHQDYKGKRINVTLKDENNFSVSAKLDVGVHKNLDIKQDEFCFNLDTINERATLIMNSKEQIICEKLKSLLRLGIRTTRYKDIFDIYYLINNTDINKGFLLKILKLLIIDDETMREKSIIDIKTNLEVILNNSIFKRNLATARNNWLEIPANDVIKNILDYLLSLELIEV